MSFVLVFMGSPDRMSNPHLRAKLAEALDLLKPPDDALSSLISVMSKYVYQHSPNLCALLKTSLHDVLRRRASLTSLL